MHWARLARRDPRALPGPDAIAAAAMLRRWRPQSMLVLPEHHPQQACVPAVDAHNHLGRWLTGPGRWVVPDVGRLIDLMDSLNITAVVNLDGRTGAELEANLDRYDRAHPGRFATFCHVDWSALEGADAGAVLARSLRRSAEQGACGLKVWKDLGLHVRDGRGQLVLLDDLRLEELWQTAAELGMPVLVHSADPPAFFRRLDLRNERLEELVESPDWIFSGSAYPSFERLMQALEATVAAHRACTFIGAHVGCYAENLAWVSRMLDEHQNFHVDISARISELGRQPRAAGRLVERHPGRVLFGTDRFPPDEATYRIHFRFLETEDEHFPYSASPVPRQGRWAISGLGLDAEQLAAVYADNARRLIPRLGPA
jgi:predicted TIM-barrel fold metal-dependent hydrolase